MSPFEAEGAWLRCALHAHTTNSDGELSPDMLVRHYEWAGYEAGHDALFALAADDSHRPDGLITACRLEKPPLAPFGRIELCDPMGRKTWTNPLWTSA